MPVQTLTMNNIESLFNYYLDQFKSVDIAESEFKKEMHADPEIRQMYRQWCHGVGSSEKNGFFDYCEEYLRDQNSVWDTLSDYNDE